MALTNLQTTDMPNDTDTPKSCEPPSSRSPSTHCSRFLILLVLLPLSILAAIYGVAWFIEETANRVMEGTEKWGNSLADWAEKKRQRPIHSENVQLSRGDSAPDARIHKQTKSLSPSRSASCSASSELL